MKNAVLLHVFVLVCFMAGLLPDVTQAAENTLVHQSMPEKTEAKKSDNAVPIPESTDIRIADAARFTPVDNDGDGLFEALIVEVDVETLRPGVYEVDGELLKNSKRISRRSNSRRTAPTLHYLPLGDPHQAGTYTAVIQLSGEGILRSGEDGPYAFKITVYGQSFRDQKIFTMNQKTFFTPAYDHLLFGEFGGLASFSGIRETAVDTDADGRYNAIEIAVDTKVLIPADYSFHGYACDSKGKSLGNASCTKTLSAGDHTVTLQFSGLPILRSGQDGPYKLGVSLASVKNYHQDSIELMTQAYNHQDFEGLLDLDGTVTDQGMDTNDNGFYDVLRVSFGADIRSAGNYRISGSIEQKTETTWHSTHSDTVVAPLAAGPQTLTLEFAGADLNAKSMDGPYEIEVTVEDATTGSRDKVTLNRTKQYSHKAFEPKALAVFTGTFTDYPIDSNNNGLYDHLAIDAEVDVKYPGTYLFYGSLFDSSDHQMLFEAVYDLKLDAGIQTITLLFSGAKIRPYRVNGPYQIRGLALQCKGFQAVQRGVHTTVAYPFLQFEPAGSEIVGNIKAFTPDADFDGEKGRSRDEDYDLIQEKQL